MIAILLERAAGALADAALKSFVIFAVAGIIVATLRKSSASSRHLVWTSAVCASIALPLFGALLPEWKSSVVAVPQPALLGSPASIPPGVASPVVDIGPRLPATGYRAPAAEKNETRKHAITASFAAPQQIQESDPAPIAAVDQPVPSRWMSLAQPLIDAGPMRVAALVWLFGFVVVLLPLCLGRLRLFVIASSARPVRDNRWEELLARYRTTGGFARRVTLLESDDTAMPMTWGVFSPILLLPSSTAEWTEWQCRNVLLHELAHVERFDCLTQFVSRVSCALYWFNPLAWTAAHRMQVEREMACDDRVIRTGSRPSEYAGQLLDVARSLRPARATAHAAIAMARPSQLSGRLTAVLDRERDRRNVSPRLRVAVGAATFGVLVPVASFSPWVTAAVASPARMAASMVTTTTSAGPMA